MLNKVNLKVDSKSIEEHWAIDHMKAIERQLEVEVGFDFDLVDY